MVGPLSKEGRVGNYSDLGEWMKYELRTFWLIVRDWQIIDDHSERNGPPSLVSKVRYARFLNLLIFCSPAGFLSNQGLITLNILFSLIKVAQKWFLNLSNNQHLQCLEMSTRIYQM